MIWTAEFVQRALIAGLGVAAVAGPLGCFVVWRRMAYFGDSLAHSALLGIALGILLGIDVMLGVAAGTITLAILLVALQQQRRLATDTLLGILSHSGLALGLIAVSYLEGLRVDLLSYLFGDLLAVTWTDIYFIYAGGGLVLAALCLLWRWLLMITVHEELAEVEGVPVLAVRLAFMLLIAIVIAIAMKIVGVLLITSMLILPAAAARRFAGTPERMAVIASANGCLSVLGGLAASLYWDTPAGPSIVVAAMAIFCVTLLAGRILAPQSA